MAVPPGAWVSVASGILIALLGIGLLLVPPRLREKAFFALFAIAWGCQVTTASIGLALDDVNTHQRAAFLSFGLFGPVVLLLIRSIRPPGGARWHQAVLSVTIAAVLLQTVALLIAPHLVVVDVSRLPDGGLTATFGPLVLPLFYVPFFIAFWLALASYHARLVTPPPGGSRSSDVGLFAGFALFGGYQTFRNLQLYLFLPPEQQVAPGTHWSYVLFFAVGSAFLLSMAVRLLVAHQDARGPRRLLPYALLAPLAMVILEEILVRAGLPVREWGSTWGFWRLATVAIIVTTIARAHLFDIDLKIRWTVEQGLLASVLASSFFVGKESLETLWPGEGVASGIVGAAIVAAVAHPAWRLATRFSRWLMPGALASVEYRMVRRNQVYRDAIRGALLDGVITDRERAVLEAVRGHLGLAAADAAAIERDLLDSFARSGRPPGARKA